MRIGCFIYEAVKLGTRLGGSYGWHGIPLSIAVVRNMFRLQVFKNVDYNDQGDQPKQVTTTAIEI